MVGDRESAALIHVGDVCLRLARETHVSMGHLLVAALGCDDGASSLARRSGVRSGVTCTCLVRDDTRMLEVREHNLTTTGAALVHEAMLKLDDVDPTAVNDTSTRRTEGEG